MNTAKKDFYIYALFRHDSGEPFYIGKGRGTRIIITMYSSSSTNRHKTRIIDRAKKSGRECASVILQSGLSEDVAHLYERAWIAALGRRDQGRGPLVNLTDGGEGASGAVNGPCTDETKAKIRAKNKGKKPSPQCIAAGIVANYGKKQSDETKQKRRDALSGRKRPPDVAAKIAAANRARNALLKGTKQSPELIAKRSASLRGRNLTEEHRRKISLAHIKNNRGKI